MAPAHCQTVDALSSSAIAEPLLVGDQNNRASPI
jgi:hypothetical protein